MTKSSGSSHKYYKLQVVISINNNKRYLQQLICENISTDDKVSDFVNTIVAYYLYA